MNIASDARELALSRKSPARVHFEISEQKAIELCDKFGEANKTIVQVGVSLMDIMLKEAMSKDKISEHVQLGVDFRKEFLQ